MTTAPVELFLGYSSKLSAHLKDCDTLLCVSESPDSTLFDGCQGPVELILTDGIKCESVCVTSFDGPKLKAIRGQSGTVPQNWPAGTCIMFKWTKKNVESRTQVAVYKSLEAKVFELCQFMEGTDLTVFLTSEDVTNFLTPVDLDDYVTETGLPSLLPTILSKADVEDCVEQALLGVELGLNKGAVETCIMVALSQLGSILNKSAVVACVEAALLDYYNKTEINDLIANLQNQILSQQTTINELVTCVQDLKEAAAVVPATASWPDVLGGDCPAISSAVVTNPDGYALCISSTGPGLVSATVGGAPVADISNFAAPDGATVTIEVTHPTDNVVGGVSVGYIDANSVKQNIDGFQYDAMCEAVNGGSNMEGFPSPAPCTTDTLDLTGNTQIIRVCSEQLNLTCAGNSLTGYILTGVNNTNGSPSTYTLTVQGSLVNAASLTFSSSCAASTTVPVLLSQSLSASEYTVIRQHVMCADGYTLGCA